MIAIMEIPRFTMPPPSNPASPPITPSCYTCRHHTKSWEKYKLPVLMCNLIQPPVPVPSTKHCNDYDPQFDAA